MTNEMDALPPAEMSKQSRKWASSTNVRRGAQR
jgi:hypothetical protein